MITPEDINVLRKSLTDLGLEEDEINVMIEKAQREKAETEEPGAETVKEMAEEEKSDESEEKKEYSEEDYKNMEEEYKTINSRKAEIEKCMGDRLNKGVDNDIQKSVGEDLRKSVEADIQKSLDERFEDIRKSIIDDVQSNIDDIFKAKYGEKLSSIDEDIKNIREDVQKIANVPFPLKSVIAKANFFEKSIGGVDEEIGGERELSISRDKQELIKGLQDEFETEKDVEIKNMLGSGITDLTISPVPSSHGQKALAYISKKRNITLVP